MSVVADSIKESHKKGDEMVTLTFETWEDFDKAIAGIVKLETLIAPDPTKEESE